MLKALSLVVLLSISMTAFGQSGVPEASKCEYQLFFGPLTVPLCDNIDTVPSYDAQGEIIGDTIIYNSVRALEEWVGAESLKSVDHVQIQLIADTARPIDIDALKLIVIRNGKTESFGMTDSKLTEAQKQVIGLLQRGDTVRITGGSFTDGGRKVNIPFALLVNVR